VRTQPARDLARIPAGHHSRHARRVHNSGMEPFPAPADIDTGPSSIPAPRSGSRRPMRGVVIRRRRTPRSRTVNRRGAAAASKRCRAKSTSTPQEPHHRAIVPREGGLPPVRPTPRRAPGERLTHLFAPWSNGWRHSVARVPLGQSRLSTLFRGSQVRDGARACARSGETPRTSVPTWVPTLGTVEIETFRVWPE
jgi:hypothetical protein